jgi:hypothetical protein
VSEKLFPSGHWTGFYAYAPQDKHRMDMHLTFARGKVAGEGNDDIGVFMVRGGYDTGTKECYFTKSYPDSHDVFYRGFREGKGIWGKWELDKFTTGGFHIWPRGEGSGDLEGQEAVESKPVDAISTEEAVPTGLEEPARALTCNI